MRSVCCCRDWAKQRMTMIVFIFAAPHLCRQRKKTGLHEKTLAQTRCFMKKKLLSELQHFVFHVGDDADELIEHGLEGLGTGEEHVGLNGELAFIHHDLYGLPEVEVGKGGRDFALAQIVAITVIALETDVHRRLVGLVDADVIGVALSLELDVAVAVDLRHEAFLLQEGLDFGTERQLAGGELSIGKSLETREEEHQQKG